MPWEDIMALLEVQEKIAAENAAAPDAAPAAHEDSFSEASPSDDPAPLLDPRISAGLAVLGRVSPVSPEVVNLLEETAPLAPPAPDVPVPPWRPPAPDVVPPWRAKSQLRLPIQSKVSSAVSKNSVAPQSSWPKGVRVPKPPSHPPPTLITRQPSTPPKKAARVAHPEWNAGEAASGEEVGAEPTRPPRLHPSLWNVHVQDSSPGSDQVDHQLGSPSGSRGSAPELEAVAAAADDAEKARIALFHQRWEFHVGNALQQFQKESAKFPCSSEEHQRRYDVMMCEALSQFDAAQETSNAQNMGDFQAQHVWEEGQGEEVPQEEPSAASGSGRPYGTGPGRRRPDGRRRDRGGKNRRWFKEKFIPGGWGTAAGHVPMHHPSPRPQPTADEEAHTLALGAAIGLHPPNQGAQAPPQGAAALGLQVLRDREAAYLKYKKPDLGPPQQEQEQPAPQYVPEAWPLGAPSQRLDGH